MPSYDAELREEQGERFSGQVLDMDAVPSAWSRPKRGVITENNRADGPEHHGKLHVQCATLPSQYPDAW